MEEKMFLHLNLSVASCLLISNRKLMCLLLLHAGICASVVLYVWVFVYLWCHICMCIRICGILCVCGTMCVGTCISVVLCVCFYSVICGVCSRVTMHVVYCICDAAYTSAYLSLISCVMFMWYHMYECTCISDTICAGVCLWYWVCRCASVPCVQVCVPMLYDICIHTCCTMCTW